MLATVSTLTKCPVLDVADDDEERARVSVSSVHSPRHLAQTGNTERTAETSKWASVTETNLQTVKFIRGLALLFRVHAISIKGRKYRDTGSVKPGSEPFFGSVSVSESHFLGIFGYRHIY